MSDKNERGKERERENNEEGKKKIIINKYIENWSKHLNNSIDEYILCIM